ncbi:MAG TPA: pyridoxamine 5'-phosphate oxidase family protein [Anaerolineaceae bacterium]|nr:pyridoxamine 5'-phosphate oxidase family protein [Anaerolineaceae bacterium]
MANENYEDNVRKLAKLIKDIQVAMLTTVGGNDGALRSWPMMNQKTPFDGTLWFFTRETTPKANEIKREQQVSLSYVEPRDQRYVSVSGVAGIVRDRAMMENLWDKTYAPWFPLGLDDPELVLLKVEVRQAEYWDAGSNKVGQVLHFVKGL